MKACGLFEDVFTFGKRAPLCEFIFHYNDLTDISRYWNKCLFESTVVSHFTYLPHIQYIYMGGLLQKQKSASFQTATAAYDLNKFKLN